MYLLTDGNAKTRKGGAIGWKTWTLELLPHTAGIDVNVCPNSTMECRKHCVAWAGHGSMDFVKDVRKRRKTLWSRHQLAFLQMLKWDLESCERYAAKHSQQVAIRLNAFSDIEWERHLLLSPYALQFYDYTKDFDRAVTALSDDRFKNYDLLYSWTELDDAQGLCPLITAKETGLKIALPGDKLKWKRACDAAGVGFIDGDKHDLTFLHEPGSLVVLKPKGSLIKANSPFKIEP